jgi:HAD superfamily hydrolase (TIGR01459 family)
MAAHQSAPVSFTSLSKLAPEYDVVLCDIWGVIHNGTATYGAAVDALRRFREQGGFVVLISNASRLGHMVASQLEQLGMPSTEYDALVTSGDIARDLIAHKPGCAVFDIGPGNSELTLEGLNVKFTSVHDADLAISSGAFENADHTPDDLRPLLSTMRARSLVLLCANPDVTTELKGRRVQCAGAVGELYENLGGRVIYAGKPRPPIYRRALALVSELRGAPVPRKRVLAIGDSLSTDIAGAANNGFASLFVGGGIHREELGADPTPTVLARLFVETDLVPTAVSYRLVW